jgi:DNA-binding GntR family transcriptional regulator
MTDATLRRERGRPAVRKVRRSRVTAVPALGRAERNTLQDQIYAKLCTAIMAGKLTPGRAVSIRGLAASLGTSPIPVREALSRLVAEQAVEVLPNGSVAVPLMSRERFIDVRRTRLVIEGYATELAAGSIGDADIEKLYRLHAETMKAFADRDAKRFLARNQRLRFIIYEATGSATLMPIIRSLWLQVGPLFNLPFVEPALQVCLGYDLEAIRALSRRDGPEARRWIERDISETGDFILSDIAKAER